MKNRTHIWLFIVFLFISFACSDFLDEDLQGVYSSDTFYKTKEQAISALNATYEIMAFTTINNCLWVFGDVASDDAIKGGNPGDQSEIEFIDAFETMPANGFVENIWQHYFAGITRANNVIYYVPDIQMDTDLKSRIIGEAKFLRAYFYFNLVNIFGEVPLKTSAILNTEDLHVPVSSVEDIYLQIETDLQEATAVLPESYSASDKGRITRGGAYGLLAKTYLYQDRWPETLDAITEIEKQAIYDLLLVYRDNFSVSYENNIESLIEIQHLSEQSPGEGSYLNQWFSPRKENGYYFNAPVQDLVDEYEVTGEGVVDPRLDYTIGRAGGTWLNGEPFDPAWSPTGYLGKKHVQPLSEIPSGTKGDADLNYTYMRFAEVLLMKAEALNESGSTPEALDPLNRVRKRARESYIYDDTISQGGAVPENLLNDISSNDQQVVRDAIRHERRVELAMEFHRFFDLVRYGADAAEAALADKGFVFDEHRYFPVPQSEIDANNAIQ